MCRSSVAEIRQKSSSAVLVGSDWSSSTGRSESWEGIDGFGDSWNNPLVTNLDQPLEFSKDI